MEKDQLDSLATVAVGSEKIPPSPHSHYAPSEIYSSSESPPAYSRPPMKSTAVQIARIIAMTLIAISIIIGSFILASAWLQARASCTPESIAAMQAQMGIQQQGELFKRLQPESLIQDPIEAKENLQSLNVVESTNTQSSSSSLSSDTKDKKLQSDDKDKFKNDNENDNDNENEDDYDDSEFPPVHIKFPLQLDLDDLAGTLMQQARSVVSCVVERRRSDEFTDDTAEQVDNNDNSTDHPRVQRLNGERVSILCQSGDPRRQESGQQEQEILTPIIVPLGQVQMPMQPQEQDYHRYQAQNQYPIPEMMRPPFPHRELNQMDNRVVSDIRNLPQIMDMVAARIGSQMNHQQQEMRPVPFELRPVPIEIIRGMRPPMNQEQQQPQMFGQEQIAPAYQQEQHTQGMVPPPPPPPPSSSSQPHQPTMMLETPQNEGRIIPQMIIRQQIEQRPVQPQENPEKSSFPLGGIPIEIRRIIQQVPVEIKNIIQHITGEMRPVNDVPEGARREEVQDFKPFPGNARPIPMAQFLPIEVRNLLEHGNIEGRRQNDYDDQSEQIKHYPSEQDQAEKDDDNDDEEKQISMPAGIRNIIHQVVQGRAFAVPRFEMSVGPVESLEVPVEARTRVMVNNPQEEKEQQQQPQQQQQQQQPQQIQSQDVPSDVIQEPQPQLLAQPTQDHVMIQHDETQEEANRPHYVQPRSVRSIPDALAHPREKRTRRCACECA
ncbi:hypothetical protein PV326_009988 [Microctonus aethiopoides]|nr:hypothetical protein PV326_009988 [Microctonus aethiopoides]